MSLRRRFAQLGKRNSSSVGRHTIASPRSTKVFGVRLEASSSDPIVLRLVSTWFDKRGYDYEGLFRLSGNMTAITDLMTKIDAGEEVDLDKVEDAHIVAGLLKQYFMLMPEPLLTFELYDCFLAASVVAKQKEQLGPLKQSLSFLPPYCLRVLRSLVKLLHAASLRSEANKMTATNLAIAFSPSIIRPAIEPELNAMVKDTTRSNTLLELLIVHFQELFDEAPIVSGRHPFTLCVDEPWWPAIETWSPQIFGLETTQEWISSPSSPTSKELGFKTVEEGIAAFVATVKEAGRQNLLHSWPSDPSLQSNFLSSLGLLAVHLPFVHSKGSEGIPTTKLQPHSFFVTANGELGLAFSGWPRTVLDLKSGVSFFGENPNLALQAERPGGRWPKLILASLQDQKSLTVGEYRRLLQICEMANSKLLSQLEDLVIDEPHLALSATRSLQATPASLRLPCHSSNNLPDPVPATSELFVDMVLAKQRSTEMFEGPTLFRTETRKNTEYAERRPWKILLVQFLACTPNAKPYFELIKQFKDMVEVRSSPSASEKSEKVDNSQVQKKLEQMALTENQEKPESARGEKPESARGEKPEQAGKAEKTDKHEKADKEKKDKPEREKKDKSEKPKKADKSEKVSKSAKSSRRRPSFVSSPLSPRASPSPGASAAPLPSSPLAPPQPSEPPLSEPLNPLEAGLFSWLPEDCLHLVLRKFEPVGDANSVKEAAPPLSCAVSPKEYEATGLQKLSAEEQCLLLAWFSRIQTEQKGRARK